MAEPAPVESVRNPYPGLRPFRADEEHLFFGREHQVDRMVDKLAAHRFLAVVGGSGSGKSSLVNCGLRPALHRGHMAGAGAAWRVAQFRPGSDPIGALATALAATGVLFDKPMTGALPAQALVESTLRLGSLGLVDMVDQADLPPGTQVLVVADQFEELFRFRTLIRGADKQGWSAAEDAVAFVRLLLEGVAQIAVPIHVVLTMRSDFLGDCAQFQGLPEAMNEGQYLVPRLTRNEIRAAITGPAGVAGATISPVLATRLLNDVGDNPDQLSILQHALNRTWAIWENEGHAGGAVELAHYEAAGGMSQALDMHAEKAFCELTDAPSRRLGEQLFKALTDKGTDARGIRRPTQLATLAEITGATPAQLQPVIDVFRKPSRSFLMPPLTEPLAPDSVIDISHESLMRVWLRLKGWADEEAQSARIYRRLRETALEHDKGNASLWRDPDLRVVLDWRAKNVPTRAWADLCGGGYDSAMGFLDRSRDAQDQEKIAADIERRWLAHWSYVPLALVLVPFIFAQDRVAALLSQSEWAKALLGTLRLTSYAGLLSHLLSGLPAVLGYMALAPYIKKRFPAWEERFGAGARAQRQEPVDATPEAGKAHDPAHVPPPPADISALGHASFWRRSAAQLADWFICGCMASVVLVIWSVISLDGWNPNANATKGPAAASSADAGRAVQGPLDRASDDASSGAPGEAADGALEAAPEPAGPLIGLLLSWTFIFWLYHVHFWTSSRQATWGMRAVGIQVTDMHGHRLSRLRATGRFFARFLSYYTIVGFLMQLFSAKHQTLHDRLSGTLVLRRATKT